MFRFSPMFAGGAQACVAWRQRGLAATLCDTPALRFPFFTRRVSLKLVSGRRETASKCFVFFSKCLTDWSLLLLPRFSIFFFFFFGWPPSLCSRGHVCTALAPLPVLSLNTCHGLSVLAHLGNAAVHSVNRSDSRSDASTTGESSKEEVMVWFGSGWPRIQCLYQSRPMCLF